MTLEESREITFSEAIWMATQDAHGAAERNGFLARLMNGELPISAYGRLIAQHRAIYGAIEDANDRMCGDLSVARFVHDELLRMPALDRDIAAVLGPDWSTCDEANVLPITQEYVERIRVAAASWSPGWVAHHYVRYLGDLSGGFHIGAAIEAAYGIDAESGTSFYRFDAIDDPVALKEQYRSDLDEAEWDEATQERFVEEILHAYHLNTVLFEELLAHV